MTNGSDFSLPRERLPSGGRTLYVAGGHCAGSEGRGASGAQSTTERMCCIMPPHRAHSLTTSRHNTNARFGFSSLARRYKRWGRGALVLVGEPSNGRG